MLPSPKSTSTKAGRLTEILSKLGFDTNTIEKISKMPFAAFCEQLQIDEIIRLQRIYIETIITPKKQDLNRILQEIINKCNSIYETADGQENRENLKKPALLPALKYTPIDAFLRHSKKKISTFIDLARGKRVIFISLAKLHYKTCIDYTHDPNYSCSFGNATSLRINKQDTFIDFVISQFLNTSNEEAKKPWNSLDDDTTQLLGKNLLTDHVMNDDFEHPLRKKQTICYIEAIAKLGDNIFNSFREYINGYYRRFVDNNADANAVTIVFHQFPLIQEEQIITLYGKRLQNQSLLKALQYIPVHVFLKEDEDSLEELLNKHKQYPQLLMYAAQEHNKLCHEYVPLYKFRQIPYNGKQADFISFASYINKISLHDFNKQNILSNYKKFRRQASIYKLQCEHELQQNLRSFHAKFQQESLPFEFRIEALLRLNLIGFMCLKIILRHKSCKKILESIQSFYLNILGLPPEEFDVFVVLSMNTVPELHPWVLKLFFDKDEMLPLLERMPLSQLINCAVVSSSKWINNSDKINISPEVNNLLNTKRSDSYGNTDIKHIKAFYRTLQNHLLERYSSLTPENTEMMTIKRLLEDLLFVSTFFEIPLLEQEIQNHAKENTTNSDFALLPKTQKLISKKLKHFRSIIKLQVQLAIKQITGDEYEKFVLYYTRNELHIFSDNPKIIQQLMWAFDRCHIKITSHIETVFALPENHQRSLCNKYRIARLKNAFATPLEGIKKKRISEEISPGEILKKLNTITKVLDKKDHWSLAPASSASSTTFTYKTLPANFQMIISAFKTFNIPFKQERKSNAIILFHSDKTVTTIQRGHKNIYEYLSRQIKLKKAEKNRKTITGKAPSELTVHDDSPPINYYPTTPKKPAIRPQRQNNLPKNNKTTLVVENQKKKKAGKVSKKECIRRKRAKQAQDRENRKNNKPKKGQNEGKEKQNVANNSHQQLKSSKTTNNVNTEETTQHSVGPVRNTTSTTFDPKNHKKPDQQEQASENEMLNKTPPDAVAYRKKKLNPRADLTRNKHRRKGNRENRPQRGARQPRVSLSQLTPTPVDNYMKHARQCSDHLTTYFSEIERAKKEKNITSDINPKLLSHYRLLHLLRSFLVLGVRSKVIKNTQLTKNDFIFLQLRHLVIHRYFALENQTLLLDQITKQLTQNILPGKKNHAIVVPTDGVFKELNELLEKAPAPDKRDLEDYKADIVKQVKLIKQFKPDTKGEKKRYFATNHPQEMGAIMMALIIIGECIARIHDYFPNMMENFEQGSQLKYLLFYCKNAIRNVVTHEITQQDFDSQIECEQKLIDDFIIWDTAAALITHIEEIKEKFSSTPASISNSTLKWTATVFVPQQSSPQKQLKQSLKSTAKTFVPQQRHTRTQPKQLNPATAAFVPRKNHSQSPHAPHPRRGPQPRPM